MIKIRIILRTLKKNLVYTWTNVVGLAIAFCFVFLTSIYVIHEYTFDQSYSDHERLFRLITTNPGSDLSANSSTHPYILTSDYEEKYPSIEKSVRAYSNPYLSALVRTSEEGREGIEETDFWYVERDFLSMFDVQISQGSLEMFDVPGTVIINRSVSSKFFKDADPIGERLQVGEDEFEIIAVYNDFPSNSSLDPRFIISMETMKSNKRYQSYFKSSGYLMFQVFISLHAQQDKLKLEDQINGSSRGSEISKVSQLKLEALDDYHFSDLDISKSLRAKADEQLIVWLVIISICLLAVAIANFGNISIAVALSRKKEIAIQKVIGAQKRMLVMDALVQSQILCYVSFIGALILIESLLPMYSNFVERELNTGILGPWTYPVLFAFASLIGLIAGLYPALLASNFKVSRLFNSFDSDKRSRSFVRNGLLAFQFFIAFGIISVMLFMNRQLQFMLSKEPGYNYQNTLVLRSSWFQGRDESTIDHFKDQLLSMSEISEVALSDEHPMRALEVNDLRKAGFRDGWEKVDLLNIAIDCHFLDFYEIEADFDKDVISLFCTQSKVGLLNETALSILENDPIGKRLPAFYGKAKPGYVIQEGAVSDFHFNSLNEPIPPMLFMPLSLSNGRAHYSIRYAKNTDRGALVQKLQDMWWEYEPTEPFYLKILEEEHQRLYSSELKMMQMTGVLGAGVCIIALAGVFAMSIFYGRERLKEVSIRKVLGAGVSQLFSLQNRVFLTLMLFSFLVAIPVVVMIVDSWFDQFAYRTNQPFSLFVVSSLIMVIATILSSGWYTMKVARINPSEILRNS